MPDGSPIDQWWKSHRPAKVTTNPKASVHFVRGAGDPRPYCGTRQGKVTTADGALVTCSACISAIAADTIRSER